MQQALRPSHGGRGGTWIPFGSGFPHSHFLPSVFPCACLLQKQELFETCAITGSYALTLYRTGVDQKNPGYLKEARNLASLGVEQILGVKPDPGPAADVSRQVISPGP